MSYLESLSEAHTMGYDATRSFRFFGLSNALVTSIPHKFDSFFLIKKNKKFKHGEGRTRKQIFILVFRLFQYRKTGALTERFNPKSKWVYFFSICIWLVKILKMFKTSYLMIFQFFDQVCMNSHRRTFCFKIKI